MPKIDTAPVAAPPKTTPGVVSKPPAKKPAPVSKTVVAETVGTPETAVASETVTPSVKPARPVKQVATDRVDDSSIEISGLDDVDEYLTVMYYGREGTHKTSNLVRATVIDPQAKILVIAAEAGLKKRALESIGVNTSQISVWPKPGQRVTYDGLLALFYKLVADLKKDPKAWFLVGFDSATEVYKTLLDQVIENDVIRQTEQNAKSRTAIQIRDRFDQETDDFRRMSVQVRDLLRRFVHLPCHIAFTALERTDEEKGGPKAKRVQVIGPAISPALSLDFLQLADVVVRTTVAEGADGEAVGVGHTRADREIRAKDRYNVLPAEMADPSFDRIFRYVMGDFNGAAGDEIQITYEGSPNSQESVEMVAVPDDPETSVEKAKRVQATRERVQRDLEGKPEPEKSVTATTRRPTTRRTAAAPKA